MSQKYEYLRNMDEKIKLLETQALSQFLIGKGDTRY